ncbi:class I tRNA ligase family protein [Candidatus Poribacteria bacterium]|nr:class I tRNA ligase family protein [Candidatus Poribacteria bacterium]MBT5714484.1 class I tRNA ligase family protein [Candidatus Poribacteria bacterium]MBT7096317.1 class I tRNA ligase family protein [Candidatus Poribacteria bacterium]MBT7808654.1 class I tRNA ligase family protein [Candidatus Poribacteria bacterium]
MTKQPSYDEFAEAVRASLSDDEIVQFWTDGDLLAQLRQKNKGRQKQVIHDIPRRPQADPSPHDLAHRVLKDIYFKAAALMGYNVSYTPSWNLFDPCAETVSAQETREKGSAADAVDVRRRSKAQVAERMQTEKELLQRLGIFADWRGIRPTLEARYEARLLDGFGALMEQGFLTKDSKPSYWCVECQTILTTDELVHRPRKSAAAYVRFPVRAGLERLGVNVSLMVWVVELWALPAGIAVALPKDGSYVAVEYEGDILIIEEETAQSVLESADLPIIERLDASELLECTCSHPLVDVELPVVHCQMNGAPRRGTGLFLAVPGHNQDDYVVRLEHNYRIVSIIDDDGRLTEDAEAYCGLGVFDASQHIALHLDNLGYLMLADPVELPYPHCWTCESPAVFRPADQWMFDPAKKRLAARAAQALQGIDCFPAGYRDELVDRVGSQEEWCASRQRVWGLPVPAFYCQKCGEQLEVERSVKAARDFISHKGTDAWFPAKADDILANDVICAGCGAREFRKDTSIVDPRMATLLTTLLNMEGRRETAAVGDIYIEQTDRAEAWLGRLLLALYATKEHFPTQFLHVCDARAQAGPEDLLARRSLSSLLDDTAGGSDMLRLLVLSEDADASDSDAEALDRVATIYSELSDTLCRLAYTTRDAARMVKTAAPPPAMTRMFATHFETTRHEIVRAFREYDFTAAWEGVRSLRADIDGVCATVDEMEETEEDDQGQIDRMKSMLREWGLQYLKLCTPFVPMLAEHVWRAGYGAPDAESIFLSEWSLPTNGNARRRPELPPVEESAPYRPWMDAATDMRTRVESRQRRPRKAVLIVQDAETLATITQTEEDLSAFVGVPVKVVAAADVTEDDLKRDVVRTKLAAPPGGEAQA